jgi:hypothetical protein
MMNIERRMMNDERDVVLPFSLRHSLFVIPSYGFQSSSRIGLTLGTAELSNRRTAERFLV